ncbi:tyrosine-protein kinase RYK [Enhydra lutris kenyoni]|uniref:Tyrosine-protein kinase RYK n=2 Tax=Mustelidae TaxID=9655 RepID=A0A2Y9KA78_ENHLU|nr:tyrosine-protein kinase RYK [Enhydra lutris kenyoni]
MGTQNDRKKKIRFLCCYQSGCIQALSWIWGSHSVAARPGPNCLDFVSRAGRGVCYRQQASKHQAGDSMGRGRAPFKGCPGSPRTTAALETQSAPSLAAASKELTVRACAVSGRRRRARARLRGQPPALDDAAEAAAARSGGLKRRPGLGAGGGWRRRGGRPTLLLGGRRRRRRPCGAARPGPRGRGRLPGTRGLRAPPPPLLLLFALLPLLPTPDAAAAPAPRPPALSPASAGPSVSLYLSEDEVRRLIGLDAELYYVRNDLISHYALSFNLLVPSETNFLHFTWHAKSKVEYKLGFQVDNFVAMDMPQVNISAQGEVPRTLSVFRVELSCTGKVDSEVMILMQLNLTVNSSKNFTVLNFKRRKMCYKKLEEVKTSALDKNTSRTIYDPVHAAPTTSTRVFYISVGVCCAVIFLVAIILAVLHLHSMKRIELDDSISASSSSQGLSQPSTQTTQYLRADTPNNATPITSYPTLRIEKNDLRSVTLLEAKAKVKDIAISRERITLKDVLQEGTFGRIFHGILVDEKDPNKEKQAFVKTVKDQASEIQVTMMLTESCKLRGLHHRNLLPITHVCIEEGEKPMVILPYMNWGNLKLFLRQCKLVEANNPQAISQQDLVHMAIQIACGMSYLARREVIHKDLAARNCVIDDTLQVKITDNALSRDLFPMDYHCLGDNENRPVRWMALESLVNNEFSSASDVWAFGVTLWELMTLGQTPYVDIDPFEMAAYLKDGYRIAQPINCPDELFAVMACCWALDPEERPKFQQLVQCLTEFHAALGAYV